MKVCKTICDKCGEEITDTDMFSLPTRPGSTYTKQVGGDMVLTPRGNRFYARDCSVVMRMNARIYVSVGPHEKDELHFHNACIDKEVRHRLAGFCNFYHE